MNLFKWENITITIRRIIKILFFKNLSKKDNNTKAIVTKAMIPLCSILMSHSSHKIDGSVLFQKKVVPFGSIKKIDPYQLFLIFSCCSEYLLKVLIQRMGIDGDDVEKIKDSVLSKNYNLFSQLFSPKEQLVERISSELRIVESHILEESQNVLESSEPSTSSALSSILVSHGIAALHGVVSGCQQFDYDFASSYTYTVYETTMDQDLSEEELEYIRIIRSHPEIKEVLRHYNKIDVPSKLLPYDNEYTSKSQFEQWTVDNEDKGQYFVGSRTYSPSFQGNADSYDKTVALYEFLERSDSIKHNADNFNAFLFRMTAVHNPNISPSEFPKISFLRSRSSLSYFIGRVVMKSNEYSEDKSWGDSDIKRPRYENGIWEKAQQFFLCEGIDAEEEEYSIQQASKDGKYVPKPRDTFKQEVNRFVLDLFDINFS